MVLGYMNGHIGDAQPGVKYIADESVGGSDDSPLDFDIANVNAEAKKVMNLTNAMSGRHVKDYNVEGSAWIAKPGSRRMRAGS